MAKAHESYLQRFNPGPRDAVVRLEEIFDCALLGLDERIRDEALSRQLAFDSTACHELRTQPNMNNHRQQ